MALKENSRKVFDYVKSLGGANVTAADIAEATGLEVRSVNGIVTSAFQKKGLMERIPAEIELKASLSTQMLQNLRRLNYIL